MGLMVFVVAGSVAAETIAVDSTADALAPDGRCGLREAILAANTDTAVGGCTAGNGADEIILPAGTYTLDISGPPSQGADGGDLDIEGTLSIRGAGSDETIIRADGVRNRIFEILVGADVRIEGVTISNGEDDFGGGIRNDGTLTLSRCAVSNNTARGANGDFFFPLGRPFLGGGPPPPPPAGGGGGGIYNSGTLTIERCEITDNTASGGNGGSASAGGGGGGGGAAGGALFNDGGTVKVRDSTLSGNSARGGNGGSGIRCGEGIGGFGGGGFAGGGGLGIFGSGMANGRGQGSPPASDGGGGGGSKGGGDGGVAGLASGGGGGALAGGPPGQFGGSGGGGSGAVGEDEDNEGRGGGGGGGGLGGAVYAQNGGRVELTGCTIENNTSIGGIGGMGATMIAMTEAGSAGEGVGGGIFASEPAQVVVEDITFGGNRADDEDDIAGAVTVEKTSLYGCASANPSGPTAALIFALLALGLGRRRRSSRPWPRDCRSPLAVE